MLGLGPWSLIWVLGFLSHGETQLALIYFAFYASIFESALCLILAVVYRKWMIPLGFTAVSAWVPLMMFLLTYKILSWILAHGGRVEYPLGLTFFVLTLILSYLLFSFFEYKLTKRTEPDDYHKT